MKPRNSSLLRQMAAIAGGLAVCPTAIAANQSWLDANAGNNWNTTEANWSPGSAWVQGNSAIFGGTAETVTLTEPITAGGLVFNAAAAYTLTGSTLTLAPGTVLSGSGNATINTALAGTGSVIANGTGIVTLGNAGAQAFSGTLTVNNGAVEIGGSTDLTAGTGITLNGGGGSVGGALYPFKGITRNGTLILRGSGDRLGSQTVTMNNGTLMWRGNGANSTMLVQNLNTASGANVVAVGSQGSPNTLTLGNLIHGADSTVEFRAAYNPLGPTGEARIAIGNLNGAAVANTNGILGGWAFVAANTTVGEYGGQARTFATWDGTNVLAATPDKGTGTSGATANNLALSTATATENWLVNGNGTAGNVNVSANTAVNSLIVSSDIVFSATSTLTIGSGGLILRDSNLWVQNGSGATGSITSGLATGQLYIQSDGGSTTSSDQAIRVAITNNGATAVKLVKSGAGLLKLDKTNTYTGGTVINQGAIQLEGGGGSAGAIRGSVTVNAGGTLILATGDAMGYSTGTTAVKTLDLNGGTLNVTSVSNQTLGSAVINMTGGAITGIATGNLDFFGGASALNSLASATTSTISGVAISPLRQGNTTFTVAQGTTASGIDLDIKSVLRNSPSANAANAVLIKAGAGTLALSGANTLSGATNSLRVDAGTLMVGNGGATGDLGGLAVTNNAALVFNRSDGALTVANAISGSGTLTQRGGGRTTLTGANTYNGATDVLSGSLFVNGVNSGTGAVNVAAGATLGGTGSIAGLINVSGVLAPGASIESLATGATSFGASSTFAYELNTAALNGDLLAVNGQLDIAAGAALTLTELASGMVAVDSKLTLISYLGGWTSGELFTYGGSSLGDDTLVTVGGTTWRFNYNDTTGGSNFTADQTAATSYVTITAVTSVPEPGAALLAALGSLALLRRRRSA